MCFVLQGCTTSYRHFYKNKELNVVSNYDESAIYFDNHKLGFGRALVKMPIDGERHYIRVAKYACTDTVVEIRITQKNEPIKDPFILPVLFGGTNNDSFIKGTWLNDGKKLVYIVDPKC